MPTYISFLRGVNVGGASRVRMEDLRDAYRALGYRNVETYIQSGNLLYDSNTPPDAGRQSQAIAARCQIKPPDVVVRSAADLRELIPRNPFAGRPGLDASRLLIYFLSQPADPACTVWAGPEELYLLGRELWVYYPDGSGRSKLRLNIHGTSRNLKTVEKILGLVQARDDANSSTITLR